MRRIRFCLAFLFVCLVGQSVFAQSDNRSVPSVNTSIRSVPRGAYVPIPTTRYAAAAKLPAVDMLTPHEAVAYVRLMQVDANSRSTLDRTIEQYSSRQGRMPRYIFLDLRDNPGGLVEEGALKVLEAFAPYSGIRCFTLIPWIGAMRPYYANARGPYADLPVAVLVSKKTASAAEIIAGTLQLWGKSIVGMSTFGKGEYANLRKGESSISTSTDGEILLGDKLVPYNHRGIFPPADMLVSDTTVRMPFVNDEVVHKALQVFQLVR